ncbi:hypothetical protein Leryth_017481 [Lithospermum erythrorhizon]|nr:hypothetical protein Leryth_017481 [Lithospermum erythrorhizon]
MTSGEFLNIHPTELKFPFEVKKQSSCSIQLTNKTDQHIAFKVKTTNPKKYSVRPNAGVVLPGSTCNVTVTMQAQKEAPSDMQSKDKFLIQSVVAPNNTTSKEVVQEMFNKEEGKVVDECKLRVVYIPANPPSPVPEGSEEGTPPRSSDNDPKESSLHEAVTRSFEEPKRNSVSSEYSSVISKLTQEKASALQQKQKLNQELDTLRRELSKSRGGGGFSMVFVLLVFIIGMLTGYLIKS